MLSYNRSVIPIIESAYEELTNVEKNIANYFIDQVEDEDLSSKAVSQRLYVSEASLSRFAKKLGFSGYRQFLFAYQDSHQSSRHLDLLTKQVLNSYQKVLEKTYSLIDNDQMVRIAKMLDEYNRVYIYGIGSSSVVAREFKLRFMRLGLFSRITFYSDEYYPSKSRIISDWNQCKWKNRRSYRRITRSKRKRS